ncbi:unnamed protein product, partial [Rotaria sp. Silwood1]
GTRSKAASGIESQTLTTPSLHPEQSDPVPVVLLVVEGGPNTLRTVYNAVFKHNIPAVFFEGTGRCCDLFAKAVRCYEEYTKTPEDVAETSQATQSPCPEEIKNKLREALNKELCEIGGVTNVSQASKDTSTSEKLTPIMETKSQEVDSIDYFESVYRCVTQRQKFLNIVSLNTKSPVEPDIDLTILKALLKATSGCSVNKTNEEQKHEQFRLALEWNRVDIVKNEIMKKDEDWTSTNLNDLFERALTNSRTEFVKLFLDHDFPLTDFIRKNSKLPLLYKNSMSNEHYQKIARSKNPLRTIYKFVLQPLIGDFFKVDVALRSERTPSHTGIYLENNRNLSLSRTTLSGDKNHVSDIEALKTLPGSLPLEGQFCFYFIIL